MPPLYTKIIKDNHLSNTKSRRTLFKILNQQSQPVSIRRIVNNALPFMNKSTAYRILNVFDEAGIINLTYAGWKQTVELSDTFKGHHHHISCIDCGQIIAFEETHDLVEQLRLVSLKYQFKATSHSLELRGICAHCSQNIT